MYGINSNARNEKSHIDIPISCGDVLLNSSSDCIQTDPRETS